VQVVLPLGRPVAAAEPAAASEVPA